MKQRKRRNIKDNTDSRINLKQNGNLSCATDSVKICGEGIDGVTRTIRTDVNNVLATLPSASTQSQIGRLYSLSFSVGHTQATPSTLVIFENPAESGRIMYLDSVFGGNTLAPGNQYLTYQSNVDIGLFRDVAITGTRLDAEQNLNFGFPGDSIINLFSSDFDPAGVSVTVAQTSQVFGHFSLDFAGKIIIPPGHNIALHLLTLHIEGNINRVNTRMTVIWYELDAPTA